MTRELLFVVPGDLDTRTGGYGYDREIIAALRSRGWTVHVIGVRGAYPTPDDVDLGRAASALADIPDSSLVIVDGLAFGVLPDQAAQHRTRLRLIALVHHPLALETGIAPSERVRLHDSEQRALEAARGVIVTSARTVAAVEKLSVPRARIEVVEPGTHRAPVAEGSTEGPVRLLCVASVVPRKGHDVLFDALTTLLDLEWRLTCVGSQHRDALWGAAMHARASVPPLAERVEFVGELEGAALEAAYRAADLFVLPTRYEGYGMVVAEALARGLTVVSTPTGAIADLVDSNVGELVAPDDAPGLSSALRRLIGDRHVLARLKTGARSRRNTRRSWDLAAEEMVQALRRLGEIGDRTEMSGGSPVAGEQPS